MKNQIALTIAEVRHEIGLDRPEGSGNVPLIGGSAGFGRASRPVGYIPEANYKKLPELVPIRWL